jgi:hypothetical protein
MFYEWEEYQQLGDLFYKQNKIKEANECWEIANNLRENLKPKFDLNKYLERKKKNNDI